MKPSLKCVKALAEWLAEERRLAAARDQTYGYHGFLVAHDTLTYDIIDILAEDSPTFSRPKFLRAAGMPDAADFVERLEKEQCPASPL
jgi:hypothetical protein